MNTTHYYCKAHDCNLKMVFSKLTCPHGNHSFEINKYDIPLLDYTLNPDLKDFDDQNKNHQLITQINISNFEPIGSRYLKHFSKNNSHLKILDVACGKGELSMWLSQNLKSPHIYSFDHSINSLNIFSASAFNLGLNNLNISMQDATSLHYKPEFFDVIVGNAVLHHFLDWNSTVFKLLSLLKPGGLLIFSEPFASGYLMIANIISSALNILKISTLEINSPEFGLLNFILNDIYTRFNFRNDYEFLNKLIDKHLFTENDFYKLSLENNLTISFETYENNDFYPGFMTLFLDSYYINHKKLRQVCEDLYTSIYNNLCENYSQIYPHYQMIKIQK